MWGDIRGWVNDALAHGYGQYHERDILTLLLMERMQLWRHEMAFAVTEVAAYPRKKVLWFVLVGGEDMDAWLQDGIYTISCWARSVGCSELRGSGRGGWERATGWEKMSFIRRCI